MSAHCPVCGGYVQSHFPGCRIGAASGVCGACEGTGWNGVRACTTCLGTGHVPEGARDLAYYLLRAADAEAAADMEVSRQPRRHRTSARVVKRRKLRSPLDASQRAAIVREYQAGASIREVAARLNVSRSVVGRALKAAGVVTAAGSARRA